MKKIIALFVFFITMSCSFAQSGIFPKKKGRWNYIESIQELNSVKTEVIHFLKSNYYQGLGYITSRENAAELVKIQMVHPTVYTNLKDLFTYEECTTIDITEALYTQIEDKSYELKKGEYQFYELIEKYDSTDGAIYIFNYPETDLYIFDGLIDGHAVVIYKNH